MGYSCDFRGFQRYSWDFMEFHDNHGISWDIDETSWDFIGFHVSWDIDGIS